MHPERQRGTGLESPAPDRLTFFAIAKLFIISVLKGWYRAAYFLLDDRRVPERTTLANRFNKADKHFHLDAE